jgi:hypothetical protein
MAGDGRLQLTLRGRLLADAVGTEIMEAMTESAQA